MAVQSSLKNMVLCLTAVCLVCAAILAGVYAVTAAPIAAAAEKTLKASIGQVLPEGGEISEAKTVTVDGSDYEYYESLNGSDVAGYAIKSSTQGFGGLLTIMVGVLSDGTIYNTSVLAHAETPGLGAKCQDAEGAFRTQFQGLDVHKTLRVTKDGGDIDAITASTITSRAYTLAVSQARKVALTLATGKVSHDAVSGATVAKKSEEGTNNE